MVAILESLGAWNWFVAGGLLLILEILAPGVFMLWLGIAALLVGTISLFVDWSWQWQFVAFAAFSIAAIPLWRRIAMQVGAPTDQPFLNRRADAFIGRTFTLEKPIIDGNGTLPIGDTIWRITGADAPAGSRVKVIAVDGPMLQVAMVQ
jgi:membrane protein implicated in regulation of membrane protease activity